MKIIIYTKEKIYNFKSILDKDYNYAIKRAHRENGPAIISYFKNNNIEYKEYIVNNKHHREDGPAIINYNKNGNINYKLYYINGKNYSEIKFSQETLKRKLKLLN